MILTLISSRQVDAPGPSRRSPKCFRNDARTNAKLLQEFTVFRVRSRLDLLRDRNRPGILLQVGGNFLAAAIRAKDLSPVELLRGVYARLHGVNDRTNAFYTLIEALVTSLRFALV